MSKGPVLIDREGAAPGPGPDAAPPVPDLAPAGPGGAPEGRAMQGLAGLATRRVSRLARWFWSLLAALVAAWLSVAAWDFATGLIARAPVLGWGVAALAAAMLLVLLVIALRELVGFARLRRMDVLHAAAVAARDSGDLAAARAVVARLDRHYAGHAALEWGRARLAEHATEQFDGATLLDLAEAELMTPLDEAARREIEAAARQVATVTAIVPLAFADVIAALTANLRMIRRVAEIYGGRAGTLGAWRLARVVLTHLVATGAVAVGDDMLGSLAGGGLLGKLSRRFGEGVVNGALTARVGVAALEVCRPLPFGEGRRPSVSALTARALKGLFGG